MLDYARKNIKPFQVFSCLISITLICVIRLAVRNDYEVENSQTIQLGTPYSSTANHFTKLDCANKGNWVSKISTEEDVQRRVELKEREKMVLTEMRAFWKARGVQTSLWREDLRCGYSVKQGKPKKSKWPFVGSWCNKDSDRPCCSDINSGLCSHESSSTCECERCLDLRSILLADMSEWIIDYPGCKFTKYNARETCDVIASSNYNKLIFVGDSLVRNMYEAFLVLLTNDPIRGAWPRELSPGLHELCSGPQRFFWNECKHKKGATDLSMIYGHKNVCSHLETDFSAKFIRLSRQSSDFIDAVTSNLGINGSLIVLGAGLHFKCKYSVVVDYFLRPAVRKIYQNWKNTIMQEKWYEYKGDERSLLREYPAWPQIMFLSTQRSGILKPIRYLSEQGNTKCSIYNREVKKYCDENNIQFINFTHLTTNVFSYDGTHYGLAVNLMKVQIFLNSIVA